MIYYSDKEEKEYERLSWNIFRFLLKNSNNPETERYRYLAEELFSIFSQVYNMKKLEEAKEFILSLEYENKENKYEISFDDVSLYESEFSSKKQLLKGMYCINKECYKLK